MAAPAPTLPVPTLPVPDPAPTGHPAGSSPPPPNPQLGPAPVASSPDAGGEEAGSGGAGFFDVSGRVQEAINGWMAELVTGALNPALRLLGTTVLATPDVAGNARVRQLWTGSLVAAMTVFGLFIVLGGALAMAHESLQTRHSIKEIVPRLFVGSVAAVTSLEIAGRIIEFANALTSAVVGHGLDPASAGERLTQLLIGAIGQGGSFMLVLGVVTAVLAVVVVFTYILRVAITVLLLVAAPLFLICHGLPQTEGAASFWWRALGGCMAIQLGQAITLLVALRVFFTPEGFSLLGMPNGSAGLVNLLVATALLWILARIPTWVSRAVFSSRRSTVLAMVRTLVMVRALGAVGLLPSRGRR